jgi:hypothetical protein
MKTFLYSPEGEGGGGGGNTGVVDAPPPNQGGGEPDLSEMSMSDAISSVFKVEPKTQPKREPKRDPKAEQKPPEKKAEVKAEVKPEVKPEAKRTSIFDTPPEAKPETTPPAPAPDDDGVAEGDWKTAKAQRKQLLLDLDKAKKELATYHQVAPDTAEIEKLRAEHKAFSERVALLDYQNHPEFQKQFVEPKQKLNAEIKTILSDNAIDGFDLQRVMSLPRAEQAKELSAVMEKMNDFDKGEFRMQLREYQKLSAAEQAALGTHKEALATLAQRNQAKQRTAFEGKWKTTSLATFAQKLAPPEGSTPEEAARITALNAGIDNIRNTAEKYAFALGDEHQAADVAIKAANYDFVVHHAFPSMQADYRKLQEQHRALTDKLQELAAHKPGTDFAGGSGPKEVAEEDLPIKDQIKKVFRT